MSANIRFQRRALISCRLYWPSCSCDYFALCRFIWPYLVGGIWDSRFLAAYAQRAYFAGLDRRRPLQFL